MYGMAYLWLLVGFDRRKCEVQPQCSYLFVRPDVSFLTFIILFFSFVRLTQLRIKIKDVGRILLLVCEDKWKVFFFFIMPVLVGNLT